MIDSNEAAPAGPFGRRRRSSKRLARYLVRRDPLACLLVMAFLVLVAAGPWLAPYPEEAINLENNLSGPARNHLLGTDDLGRDVASRLIGASRIAAEAAAIVVLIAGVVGIALGGLAGGLGGVVDLVVSRVTEVIQGFPIILLAIAIVGVIGPSLRNAMIAVGIGGIPNFVRVTRGMALQLRSRDFIVAARSVGASEGRVLLREYLPNMVGPLVVVTSFEAAHAVLYESSLSFLGLGAQPPTPSFGAMLSEAKSFLSVQPWYAIVTGTALAAVILGFNLLGDALSDYFSTERR